MEGLKALFRVALLCAAFAFLLPTAYAGNDTWTTTGHLNGGDMIKVLIDPTSPSTLYACAYGGFFKSTDAGASWSEVLPALNRVYDAAIEPENPTTLYLTTDNIYKSTDGGVTWTEMENGIETVAGSTEQDTISNISVDPVTDGTAYAVTRTTGLYKTTNGGQSWNTINTGLTSLIASASQLGDVVVDPVHPQTLYLASGTFGASNSSTGIYKSTDGGSQWTASITGVTASDVEVDPNDDTHVFAVIDQQVYESTNSGASGGWTALTSAPSNAEILRIDPTNSQNLTVSTSTGAIYYSTNGGTNWTEGANNSSFYIVDIAIDPVTPANVYVSTGSTGLYKSTDGGKTLTESDAGLYAVGGMIEMVMGGDGAIYIGSTGSGIFKSTDLGVHWSAVNNGLAITSGVASIYALVEDPNTSTTLYAGSPDGLFKTTNGGTNWTLLSNGKTDPYTFSVAVDPENSNTVYAGTASDGLFKSTDAGSSWQSASNGLPTDTIRSLAVDPGNSNIVYAGTGANGLYRSTDGGAHWSADNNGLIISTVEAIRIDPANSQIIYLSLANNNVYKSTDGGANWAASSNGMQLGYLYPNLIMDPTDPATMYAVPLGVGEDLDVTTDAGTNWVAMTPLGLATTPIPVMITAAALDPNHPQDLYGAASDGQIYVFSSVTPTTMAGSVTTTVNTSANAQLSGDLQGFGGTLNFAIATPPAHGKVAILNAVSGTFTYTPTSGFTGSDSFTFTVSAAGAISAPTTESITVKPASKQSSSSGGGGIDVLMLGLFIVSVWRRKY